MSGLHILVSVHLTESLSSAVLMSRYSDPFIAPSMDCDFAYLSAFSNSLSLKIVEMYASGSHYLNTMPGTPFTNPRLAQLPLTVFFICLFFVIVVIFQKVQHTDKMIHTGFRLLYI